MQLLRSSRQCRTMSATIGGIRTSPNTQGNPVRAITYGNVVEVGAVKTDGDAESIRGDNRWLWLASGEGFAWAGNFRIEA
jgi:hypothetical protein